MTLNLLSQLVYSNPKAGPDSAILVLKGASVSLMTRNNKSVNKNVSKYTHLYVSTKRCVTTIAEF